VQEFEKASHGVPAISPDMTLVRPRRPCGFAAGAISRSTTMALPPRSRVRGTARGSIETASA